MASQYRSVPVSEDRAQDWRTEEDLIELYRQDGGAHPGHASAFSIARPSVSSTAHLNHDVDASTSSPILARQLITEHRKARNSSKHTKSKRRGALVTPAVFSNPRKRKILIIATCVLVVVALAVAIPLAVLSLRSNDSSQSSSSSSDPSKPAASPIVPWDGSTSGVNGSTAWFGNGSVFTYVNEFGGDWKYDPKDTLGPGGKAQSWSKRIGGGDEWVWGEDVIRGVNLGGWLVTEPFICPGLYEKYINTSGIPVVDEWTLALAMGDKLAEEMEEHYATFITEKDIADIAGAGLNWVRIPLGFWAIETINDEPFLKKASWTYFTKAVSWCRKYGIRILLDLHALPGSQNGWNHSGKAGTVNFMNGVMGIANAQRTLSYLAVLTELVSQDDYKDVVLMVGIVNEILWGTIGETSVKSFYHAAYEAMRNTSGTGEGKGPYVLIHEGFQGTKMWEGFLEGADRLALDQHPYLAFMNDLTSTPDEMAVKPCDWAIATNESSRAFGVTVGGEFSTAINNCGLWLNGIGSTPAGYDCAKWDNWEAYTPEMLAAIKNVAMASMDALQNFFFWTWKIGDSTVEGTSSSPLWHYQLGRDRGWIPRDPREAVGHCAGVLNGQTLNFDGKYPTSATGGGEGVIVPTQVEQNVFPPVALAPTFSGGDMGRLPTYTATGKFVGPTPTPTSGGQYVAIAGCVYPDPWNAINATLWKEGECT